MGQLIFKDADVEQRKEDKKRQPENVIPKKQTGRQTPFREYTPEFDYDPYGGQLDYIQGIIPEITAMKQEERSKFPVINFNQYSDKLRSDGTYDYVAYTNKNGILEFIYDVDRPQAEAERKHRTSTTSRTAARD